MTGSPFCERHYGSHWDSKYTTTDNDTTSRCHAQNDGLLTDMCAQHPLQATLLTFYSPCVEWRTMYFSTLRPTTAHTYINLFQSRPWVYNPVSTETGEGQSEQMFDERGENWSWPSERAPCSKCSVKPSHTRAAQHNFSRAGLWGRGGSDLGTRSNNCLWACQHW